MSITDYQVQIQKDGMLLVVNPDNNQTLAVVPFAGQIMKGCVGRTALQVPDIGQPTSRTLRPFDTLYSFGHFSSTAVPGVISMQQNPKLPDSGYEIQLSHGHEYPKQQFWSMFGIFTVDLSGIDPSFTRFQVANRAESPVRLTVTLQRPWGEEPLIYVMMDELVPLYPWDASSFDFSTVCPLTGGAPRPVAFIKKDADLTKMSGAWQRVAGVLVKTL